MGDSVRAAVEFGFAFSVNRRASFGPPNRRVHQEECLEAFSHFGGLDFSGAKEPLSNLWTAVGVARDERLHVLDLRPHAFRLDAMDFVVNGWRRVAGADTNARCLWGCDFPFCVPADLARQLCGGEATWQDLSKWVASNPQDDLSYWIETYGSTKRSIDAGAAMAPLNTRLQKQTVEGLRMLARLTQECGAAVQPQAPQDNAPSTLIEVYPSQTAIDLNLLGRKPNRKSQVRARASSLEPYLSFDHPAMEATAVTLEDAWDAVLACLTAYLVREDLDQPYRAGNAPREMVMLEGWIYRHPQVVGGKGSERS
jgi:hypothetical protein